MQYAHTHKLRCSLHWPVVMVSITPKDAAAVEAVEAGGRFDCALTCGLRTVATQQQQQQRQQLACCCCNLSQVRRMRMMDLGCGERTRSELASSSSLLLLAVDLHAPDKQTNKQTVSSVSPEVAHFSPLAQSVASSRSSMSCCYNDRAFDQKRKRASQRQLHFSAQQSLQRTCVCAVNCVLFAASLSI